MLRRSGIIDDEKINISIEDERESARFQSNSSIIAFFGAGLEAAVASAEPLLVCQNCR
jgi:hypothetical protein